MRYFIVMYMRISNGLPTYGNCTFEVSNYLNNRYALHRISKEYNTDTGNITITNIIELKEKDYQEWIR